MKKLFVVFFCLILLTSCSLTSSTTTVKSHINSLDNKTVEDYLDLIGEEEENLVAELGKPDSVETLYGGRVYYYDSVEVGFGVEGNVVNSVLLYRGRLNEDIYLDMSIDEALANLSFNGGEVHKIDEQTLLTKYGRRECYLLFHDGHLVEVLVK